MTQLPGDHPITAEQAAGVGTMAAWPTVLVRPLANLTANPEEDYLSIGLTAELAHEPDHGQTWSMLASFYADNYGLEMVDLPPALEKAVEYAQKGVSLDPTNRCARMILAYVRFVEDKLPEARHEARTAYHLCPNSLMVLDIIGWLMALT